MGLDLNEELLLIAMPPDQFAQGIATLISTVMKAKEKHNEKKTIVNGLFSSSSTPVPTTEDTVVSFTQE